MLEESTNARSAGRRTWQFQQTAHALIVMELGKMPKWRECLCCSKLHEVELTGKKPGFYRKRGKDGLYHDFVKGMPPRSSWEKVRIHCIICNSVHDLLKGPVTGKLYSQECDRI